MNDLPKRDQWGDLLPERKLGATGESVTMLGTGGAHVGRAETDAEAHAIVETAISGGVRFFDTAHSYQSGRSEERYGRFLTPKYRDGIFLMTKTTAKDAKTARENLETSLRRMKTDCLDLWQAHSLKDPDDVDARIENGVVDVFEQAKMEGKARYIGFTGHKSPYAHARMLERTDVFDAAQLPINCADPSFESFVLIVLPELVRRKMGVLAMKSLSNGGFFGGDKQFCHGPHPLLVPERVSIEEAVSYTWSHPVSVLITGADNADQLQEKIEIARRFRPLAVSDMQTLVDRVSDRAGNIVEFYKREVATT
ncbi:MAG: aldo/keto reductase [Gemmatimonadetes bacterium]|jgi:aryl-alcohol dehydrogenase-like predicted oxidoreductase|nr:aldo/keto reductase [Gemmatimonadota bacterium]